MFHAEMIPTELYSSNPENYASFLHLGYSVFYLQVLQLRYYSQLQQADGEWENTLDRNWEGSANPHEDLKNVLYDAVGSIKKMRNRNDLCDIRVNDNEVEAMIEVLKMSSTYLKEMMKSFNDRESYKLAFFVYKFVIFLKNFIKRGISEEEINEMIQSIESFNN